MGNRLISATISDEASMAYEKMKKENEDFNFSKWISMKLEQELNDEESVEKLKLDLDLSLKKKQELESHIGYLKDKIEVIINQERGREQYEKEKSERLVQGRKEKIDDVIDSLQTFYEIGPEDNILSLSTEFVDKYSNKFGTEGKMSIFQFGQMKKLNLRPENDPHHPSYYYKDKDESKTYDIDKMRVPNKDEKNN